MLCNLKTKLSSALLVKNKLTLIPIVVAAYLVGCSSANVPQVGAVAPCQIQSNGQVERAIRSSLKSQHWEMDTYNDHMIQAHKTVNQMTANIDIAYGYRGFSIEYADSQNMHYNDEEDSIDPVYLKWVYNLKGAIEKELQKQVQLDPSVKCLGKDVPA